MTCDVSRLGGRRADAGPARFLRRLAEALAAVRFVSPTEEDAELARVERFAREVLGRKARSGG